MSIKNHLLTAALVTLNCTATSAQNMVPNPSFEAYNACPTDFSGPTFPSAGIGYSTNYTFFPTVQAWTRPMDYSTPDYFNTCAAGTNVGVPQNFFSYRWPRTGNAYAGMYTYHSENTNGKPTEDYRELISVKLTAPMKKDSSYCVSFFVIPTYKGWTRNNITVNDIGANFSDTLPYHPTAGSMSLSYHIINDTARHLDDTGRWYEISGIYQAKGGEQYMTIGSLKRSVWPAWSMLPGFNYDPNKPWSGYAFLDDVSVVQVKHYTYFHDTTYCDTSLARTRITATLAGASYKWSTSDSTQSISVTKPGLYWCRAVKDCEVHTDSFRIDIRPTPAPLVRDTTVCMGVGSPLLHVTGSHLMWYVAGTGATGSAAQPTISTKQEGTTTLYVASEDGPCKSTRVPVHITVVGQPLPQRTTTVFLCNDEAQSLTIGNGGKGGFSYQWNTGDTSCCITATAEGTYLRSRSNACGSITDSFVMNAGRCNDCVLFPTAFSPNGDGLNDAFHPLFYCPVKTFYMRIYNRWGECVYVSYTKDSKWDGLHHGVQAPAGVYMYVASAEHSETGRSYLMKGDLTLIR